MSQLVCVVNVKNANANVIGVGTYFTGNVSAGHLFTVAGSGVTYHVGSVTNNTILVLTSPYAGVTANGVDAAIVTDFTPNMSLPLLRKGDIETATIISAAFEKLDDVITLGAQGATGSQGIQGRQGATGTTGTQGATGIQGTTDIQGTTGIQGRQGTTGAQGTAGTNGSQGATGLQGIQGRQGTTGTTGTQGATGIQGTDGDVGISGSQGTTGSQGTAGTNGSQGATGLQGIQGRQGATGSQGIQGRQGATGATGGAGVGSAANQQIIFSDSGTANGDSKLTWNKAAGNLVLTGNLRIQDGTETNPSIHFISDPGTGFSRDASNTIIATAGGQIGFKIAGVETSNTPSYYTVTNYSGGDFDLGPEIKVAGIQNDIAGWVRAKGNGWLWLEGGQIALRSLPDGVNWYPAAYFYQTGSSSGAWNFQSGATPFVAVWSGSAYLDITAYGAWTFANSEVNIEGTNPWLTLRDTNASQSSDYGYLWYRDSLLSIASWDNSAATDRYVLTQNVSTGAVTANGGAWTFTGTINYTTLTGNTVNAGDGTNTATLNYYGMYCDRSSMYIRNINASGTIYIEANTAFSFRDYNGATTRLNLNANTGSLTGYGAWSTNNTITGASFYATAQDASFRLGAGGDANNLGIIFGSQYDATINPYIRGWGGSAAAAGGTITVSTPKTGNTVTFLNNADGNQFRIGGANSAEIYRDGTWHKVVDRDQTIRVLAAGTSASNTVWRYIGQKIGVKQSLSAQTGCVLITAPFDDNGTMTTVKLRGYNYSTANGAWEMAVSYYAYSANSMNSMSAEVIYGEPKFTQVKFGYNEANANVIIQLGDPIDTGLNYSYVEITEVIVTHTGGGTPNDLWATGWKAEYITDDSTLNIKGTLPLPNANTLWQRTSTIYGQANAAYAAANSAANTVRVSANSGSTLVAANGVNFVNTATVTVSVASGVNGNANVSFTAASGGTPGGSDTQLQYNNGGAFGGTSGLTWDDTRLVLQTGNIADSQIVAVTAARSANENCAGRMLVVNSASAVTVTFTAAAFAGFTVGVLRSNTGNVTIANSGVTKLNTAGYLTSNLASRYSVATVLYTATNEIVVFGDIL